MKTTHNKIMLLLKSYLNQYPDQRFGQALFNLDINQFKDDNIKERDFSLRDIYNDEDEEIIKRIRSRFKK